MTDEIVRITDRALVASILGIHDDRIDAQVLSNREMTKAEWVQFLERNVQNENYMRIWGTIEGNRVVHYLVASNVVIPPLAREVALLYSNFYGAKDESGQEYAPRALELVKEWGRGLGAKRIHTYTAYPNVMSRFGFVREDEKIVSVILPL